MVEVFACIRSVYKVRFLVEQALLQDLFPGHGSRILKVLASHLSKALHGTLIKVLKSPLIEWYYVFIVHSLNHGSLIFLWLERLTVIKYV